VSRSLSEIIDRFNQVSILVLGDFILDEFVYGEITRISREAPVLILSYQNSRLTPGGGANTVAGVAGLGAKAVPVGHIGEDAWGEKLLEIWPESVDRNHVVQGAGLGTTRKTRFLAGSFHSFQQQVVRIDYEHPYQLTPSQESEVESRLEKVVPEVDAVILSDYSLGNVTPALRSKSLKLARHYQKPIVVDSRFDPSGFRGATSITPNITEVEQAINSKIGHQQADLEEVGIRAREEWEVEALLITRGKLGMSLFTPDEIIHIPIYGTDEVVDVTGAGDTVISTYTTALATGATFEEAARLANIAGGIVVTKKGTATVSDTELREAVRRLAG
jgi:rfaE bifunctional protein kinase chain/domain